MASPTQWIWTWENSKRWWGTGKPGMLQSMGSWRVIHNLMTEQQTTIHLFAVSFLSHWPKKFVQLFSVTLYRKTWTNFLVSPILWASRGQSWYLLFEIGTRVKYVTYGDRRWELKYEAQGWVLIFLGSLLFLPVSFHFCLFLSWYRCTFFTISQHHYYFFNVS